MRKILEHFFTSRREAQLTNPENRVLVLGSRITGAFELGEAFLEYLKQKDVPEPTVDVQRDAGRIEQYILGRETLDQGRKRPNLPRGVILLPEMRQETPTGRGTSVIVYDCGISVSVEKLCKKYGIPLVEIKTGGSREQILGGVMKLLEPQK